MERDALGAIDHRGREIFIAQTYYPLRELSAEVRLVARRPSLAFLSKPIEIHADGMVGVDQYHAIRYVLCDTP